MPSLDPRIIPVLVAMISSINLVTSACDCLSIRLYIRYDTRIISENNQQSRTSCSD